MIKNIILDIGGVIFDDSKKNIEKLLKKNCDNIYSKAYGKGFKQALLGKMTIKELIDSLRNEYEFNDIKYILDKNNLKKSYPIIKDNYEYIKTLKQRGYNLYLLSNITEDSYNYINDLINIDETFKGGVYSYQENIVKPNYEIYNLILSKYNLKKEETIFFDDKEKNINAANEVGLNSYVFNTIEDIEKIINSNIPITELIKRELLERTKNSKDKDGFDFWEDHIKYVVDNAIFLANKYNADVEIVKLGALLHDIAMPSNIGPREEHHIYGAKIAEELLNKYNYPKDRIERVKQCVLNHRGSKNLSRNTIEEEIIADADAMSHFDAIPSLFSLAYSELNLDIHEGAEFVKKKLERDYNKLSSRTKELVEDKYKQIMKSIFKG